ncbi:MAG: glycosyltransferase, partial [Anaerolineales bacterium]|nr:glycosyltransferase [Anaerolineales bacterium]
ISGKMSYHANITMTMHMVQDIMPLVWQSRPDVKLMIVGKDPTSEIEALAENPNIVVTGTVDHLPPYLQRATIAVVPIAYNAGIQNKVLEALACATPVITSPQAVAHLPLEPDRDLLVAGDAPSFAQHILNLLADPVRQQQLGRTGRAYVERYHNWNHVAVRLEEIYTAVQPASVSAIETAVIPQVPQPVS